MSNNPLPPCPGTPNCVRKSRPFSIPPAALFDKALEALDKMGPIERDVDAKTYRIHAVFRVFFFKDDVDLAITPSETGADLHIRSKSRLGEGDFGVNSRRVSEFFDTLNVPR